MKDRGEASAAMARMRGLRIMRTAVVLFIVAGLGAGFGARPVDQSSDSGSFRDVQTNGKRLGKIRK